MLEVQPNNNSKNNKYTSPYETEFILVMHWVPTTIKLYNYVSVTVDKWSHLIGWDEDFWRVTWLNENISSTIYNEFKWNDEEWKLDTGYLIISV